MRRLLPLTCAALGLAIPIGAAADDPPAFVELNGALYRVEKSLQEGGSLFLHDGGLPALTPGQLRTLVAAQPPRIITRALERALAEAPPTQLLPVIAVLREQPAGPLSRALWDQVQPLLDEINAELQEVNGVWLARPSMPPGLEAAWNPPALHPADREHRTRLLSLRDDLERDTRRRIHEALERAVAPSQARLAPLIEALGGTVTARTATVSILGARVPASRIGELAIHPLVARLDLDAPGAPELDNHKVSLGLTTGFWPAGVTGGVHDVGVLDTGVQQNHPFLSSHRFLSNMGPSDTDTHGTGMAGILASTHGAYTGMAHGCDTIVVALAGTISTSMPGMDYIASTGEPENVNYSFGNGTANASDYTPTDQFFDAVIDTYRFMVSKSTGNGGFGNGAPTITHPAPAYNLLASANVNDAGTIPRADDRIDTSSSRGPTLAGRKKPDIAAPGYNSMSTHPAGAFANIGGTSSASPHTGGGIVLLYDLGVPSVLAAKAILLNTTDAITDNNTATTGDDQFVPGSHWSRRYGWGYLNLGQAFLHGPDVFTDSVPDEPEDADYRLYAGQMFTDEKATLVWNRHVAYNGAAFPAQVESLSDLDLFAYTSDGTLAAQSVSAIDSVEQLDVSTDGTYVLKVEASGPFDPEIPVEPFALATQENFAPRTGPSFTLGVSEPASVPTAGVFDIQVQVKNRGDLPAIGATARLEGLLVVSGANPVGLGTIPVGEARTANWTVRAQTSVGPQMFSVLVRSLSFGEEFHADAGGSVSITGCYADCDQSGALDVGDFICFQTRFALGDPYADCDANGVHDVNDSICFQTRFAVGCP